MTGFGIIFILVLGIFVWSYFQQQAKITRPKSREKEVSTPSPKKKKPFIRIERVED